MSPDTGIGFTVTVNKSPLLTQPFAFVTVNMPLYVLLAAAPGTIIDIGLAPKADNTTSEKPSPSAVTSKSMIYWFGVSVVAV